MTPWDSVISFECLRDFVWILKLPLRYCRQSIIRLLIIIQQTSIDGLFVDDVEDPPDHVTLFNDSTIPTVLNYFKPLETDAPTMVVIDVKHLLMCI